MSENAVFTTFMIFICGAFLICALNISDEYRPANTPSAILPGNSYNIFNDHMWFYYIPETEGQKTNQQPIQDQ